MSNLDSTSPSWPSGQRLALVVAGMHRSGTSAITKALSLLGASLPRDLIPPAASNFNIPYWESKEVQEINEGCLRAAGTNAFEFHPLRPQFFESESAALYQRRATAYLEAEFQRSPRLVLKNPRMCRLLPLWQRALQAAGAEARYVLPVRNPLEVSASLKRRNGTAEPWAHLLWLRHVLDAELYTRGLPRVVISYDQLLTDWRRCLNRIIQELRLEEAGLDAAAEQELSRALSPQLRTHTFSDEDVERSFRLPEPVRRVYELHRVALSGACLEQFREELDAIREDFDRSCSLFGFLLPEAGPLLYQSDGVPSATAAPVPGPRSGRPGSSVSGIILTWNGAARLEKVLPSLASLASELLVFIDSATSDASADIARRFTPHVFEVPHLGTQEAHYGRMIARCQGDWVFSLDDDEAVENWDAGLMEELLFDRNITHFYMPRKWVLPGEREYISSAPWYPDYQMRLFRNIPSILRLPSTIHDEVRPAGQSRILQQPNLLHYTLAWKSRRERQERLRLYQTIRPHESESLYLYEDHTFQTAPLGWPVCRPGELLSMSAGSAGLAHLGEGWFQPESWGVWMNGHTADLLFQVDGPGNLLLEMDGRFLLHERHPKVDVTVMANGIELGHWRGRRNWFHQKRFRARVPAGSSPAGRLRIRLRCHNPVRPRELNGSADDRLLGLGLHWVRLSR